jgi:hypothetical protein
LTVLKSASCASSRPDKIAFSGYGFGYIAGVIGVFADVSRPRKLGGIGILRIAGIRVDAVVRWRIIDLFGYHCWRRFLNWAASIAANIG